MMNLKMCWHKLLNVPAFRFSPRYHALHRIIASPQSRAYRQALTLARRETEEKRIASIIETKTTVLPKMPVRHISAKVLLLGEDVEQVVAEEEERERNTDPVHESTNVTRKLSKEWLVETEQRTTVKVNVDTVRRDTPSL